MSPRASKSAPPAPGWGNEPLRRDPAELELERRISTTRPTPPECVGEDFPECFVPDHNFADWIRGTFIDGSGPLANEHHEHLMDASIGVLWTNAINMTKMRHVLATAEMPQIMGGAWKRGRFEQQLRDWFGDVPTFLHTYYAPGCLLLNDRSFCALCEHELCHCGQAEDQYQSPKFGRMGEPIFAMRGHDVEEFVDVAERYGPTTPEMRQIVRASTRRPLVGDGPIAIACGTCGRIAA